MASPPSDLLSPPSDLASPGPPPDLLSPPSDLVAAPKSEPGFISTLGSAAVRGVVEGGKESLEAAHPFQDRPAPAQDNSHLGKLLQQPISEGYGDPNWWAAQIAYGAGKTAPSLALGAAGAIAGEAVAPEGVVAGPLVGGAAGFALGSMIQEIAPAYQRARAAGLDHDAAVNRALADTGIAGAFGAAMGLAPGVSIFGKTAEQVGNETFMALKRPISEALAQIFAVQPGIGAAQQVAQGAVDGKLPSADDLATAYASNVGMGLAMTGAHAVKRAVFPEKAPAGAPGEAPAATPPADAQARPGEPPPPAGPAAPASGMPAATAADEIERTGAIPPEPKPVAQQADEIAAAAPTAKPHETAAAVDKLVDQATGESKVAQKRAETQAAAAVAEPEPSDAQKEAGNYRKGHISIHGIPVTIETPKGATRRGPVGDDGQPAWENTSPGHYGYIKKTEGADGEHVDAYVGDHPDSKKVFLVDQIDPATGKFDEHKAILGTRTRDEATALYNGGFSDGSGPSRMGDITEMPVDTFKRWLKTDDTTKPFAYQEPLPPPPETPESQRIRGLPSTRAPKGLLDWIAKEGGMQDPGGELRAMDLHKPKYGFRPGFGWIRSPNGRHPDKVREAAEEQGLLPAGSTIADLHAAIDNELKSTPEYRTLAAAPDENEPLIDQMRQRAHELGIEHDENTPADDLLAAIQEREAIQAEDLARVADHHEKEVDDYLNAFWPEMAQTIRDEGAEAIELPGEFHGAPTEATPQPEAPRPPPESGEHAGPVAGAPPGGAEPRQGAEGVSQTPGAGAGEEVKPTLHGASIRGDQRGLQVRFPEKPPRDVLDALKAAGFRWSKIQGLWYAPRTPASEEAANKLRGGTQDEQVKTSQPKEGTEPASGDTNRHVELALSIARRIDANMRGKAEGVGAMSWRELLALAESVHGSKLAEGKFTRDEMYDALELGVNLYIRQHADRFPLDPARGETKVRDIVGYLGRIKESLPTQTVRAGEKETHQQFSTPPDYAYAANWVAKVSDRDTMLEPSAGTGSLAVHAMNAGAHVVTNEISGKRKAMLDALEPARSFKENAEQLHNILPEDVKPTVVVMNPPFSATAGRMGDKMVLETGAKHIEQALKRLESGGRLVAIVGRGMAADASRFKDWWQGIGRQYEVKANVGVDGGVYAKYGTNFGTRLLVIDKVPPTGKAPVMGDVADIPGLITKLAEVRDARPEIERPSAQPGTPAGERVGTEPPREGVAPERRPGSEPGQPVRAPTGTEGVPGRDTAAGARGPVQGGPGDRGGEAAKPETRPGEANPLVQQQPERPGTGGAERDPRASTPPSQDVAAGRTGGDGDVLRPPAGGERPLSAGTPPPDLTPQVRVDEHAADPTHAGEITEAVYEPYKPQRVKIEGAQPHPGKLVQSAAMATVQPPKPAYNPALPQKLITSGALSDAQLEAIIYAGQAHSQFLPHVQGETPVRRGFFIGDGTGVGKGREVSGIIRDQWEKGSQKHLWVSENRPLINDARRDWTGIGGHKDDLLDLSKTDGNSAMTAGKGILFTSYDTLKSSAKGAVDPKTGSRGKGKSRLDQVGEWLGKDFDGVIAFDEAHNMANSIDQKGGRGVKEASAKALAGIELQKRFPNARIVYVSATGATEVSNLAYAERLGLWGRGTAFPKKEDFISEVSSGGVAAMELVARDMKALGHYMARNLSYDGVDYDRIEHKLEPHQREVYDKLAEAWQVTLNHINEALGITEAHKNADAKSRAMSAYWGTHQRFFNQVITSMQMPSVIGHIEKDVAEGRQSVLQLVNTNEAAQERAIAKTNSEEELEDLDMTPRDQLMQMVEHSFPIYQYEQYMDESGNIRSQLVKDSDGNPVVNKEAVALRDKLLDDLGSIRVPEGPLETILNHFGTDKVSEVTGRKRRVVRKADDKGTVRAMVESRPGSANVTEADAFQQAKKPILIFSQAGGTGRSYHAEIGSPSEEMRRSHYLVQAGWRADKAIQGFGRTHRTNEASQPIFHLVTTDLNGQKRFISSIARRLSQLGALTKGERRAGDQGMFSARDNLESQEAKDALYQFYRDLHNDNVEGIKIEDFERQTGLRLRDEKTGGLKKDLPGITQFLNRLLSLKIDTQNATFNEFARRLDDVIDQRAAEGNLDTGVETVKADKITKDAEKVVYRAPETGAETNYAKYTLSHKNNPVGFDDISAKEGHKLLGYKDVAFYARNKQTGKVYAVAEARPQTEGKSGKIVEQYRIADPMDYRFIPRDRIDGYAGSDRWEKIKDGGTARKLWDDQVSKIPEYRKEDLHLITGAILPIWDRLKGSTKVYRLQTDQGERALGRVIHGSQVKETLKALGAEAAGTKIEPKELADRIVGGATAQLANGWKIKRSLVAGEPRMEIIGPDWSHNDELKRSGVFTERIGYTTRYFVPTGERAEGVLKSVLERRPVTDISDPRADEAAAMQQSGTLAAPKQPNETEHEIVPGLKGYRRTGDDTAKEQRNRETFDSVAKKMFPHAQVDVFNRIVNETDGKRTASGGAYTFRDGIIAASLASNDAEASIRHEGIHYLRGAGLIRDGEWDTLKKAAQDGNWRDRWDIDKRYPARLGDDRLTEESIAEEFSQWRRLRSPQPGPVRSIFHKLDLFMRRVAAAAREFFGRNATANDIFSRIESGEVGRRQAGAKGGPDLDERAAAQPRPFRNVPDNLMGFRKDGPQRGFGETNYQHEQPVRIHWADGQTHEDAVKGMNPHHAVERAYRNWPDAKYIEPIDGAALQTEKTDQGEQHVIPGAERETPEQVAARQRAQQKQEAELRMRGGMKGKKPQERADDLPLFGGKDETHLLQTIPGEEDPESAPTPYGRAQSLYRKAIDGMTNIVGDVERIVAPMATGTDTSRAVTKDFANGKRLARYEGTERIKWLTDNLSPAQWTKLFDASEEESLARRRGESTEGIGISRLTPQERAIVHDLQNEKEKVFRQAIRLGMFRGDGIPFHTPRKFIQLVNGLAESLPGRRGTKNIDQFGKNLRTSSPHLLHRAHETIEESEAAAKAKFGDDTEVVRDIRALAVATMELQDAVAGRAMVNKIKEIGRGLGTDLVHEDGLPEGENPNDWFTVDHPAFYTRVPAKFELDKETGRLEPVRDSQGNVITKQTQVKVRKDFEGPLKAVLSSKEGPLYRALMDLKGRTMSVIMYSPLIHNAVEWGRALPAMPGKVLTGRIYFEGNRAKNDPAQMREAILDGITPVGQRYGFQDMTSVLNQPNIAPGRSWTAKLIGAVPGMFDQKAGDAVKRAVDKMGDFWHNTLLWDRVADLQMGLYTNMRDKFMAKGLDRQTAGRLAAHEANRFAGALPLEAMSKGARQWANFLFFSRSFTFGNLGVMKDALTGMPRDIQSQILRDSGELALKQATSMAKRKALAVIGADMALMYVGNAALQSAIAVMTGNSTGDKEVDGYVRRLQKLGTRAKENPLDLLNPFKDITTVMPQGENEPGKEDRVLVGHSADGTAIYMRNPTGKIGEEFMGWLTGPLDMLRRKQGTIARPLYQTFANDAGFGHKLYDPYADTPSAWIKNMGRIVTNFMGDQVPMASVTAARDMLAGRGDKQLEAAQMFGPLAGLTFSKGYPGGPQGGLANRAKQEHDFAVQEALPGIRRTIQDGDIGKATDEMGKLKFSTARQRATIWQVQNPGRRMSRRQIAEFKSYASPEEQDEFDRLSKEATQ